MRALLFPRDNGDLDVLEAGGFEKLMELNFAETQPVIGIQLAGALEAVAERLSFERVEACAETQQAVRMSIMHSKPVSLVCGLTAAIICSPIALALASQSQDYSAFLDAAKSAKVEVRRDQIVSITRDNDKLITAPLVSWERQPSTALNRGVDVAFVYSSATSGRFPPGYYTVRAFAKVTKVGRVDGTFHLINRAGNVVAKLPAVMEVHSLTIPRATTQRSFATIGEETNAQGLRIRITVHCCSNGTCTITIHF
ncbi:MAG: hypothetical protein WAO00_05800 [Chthoniobacterales bacterium]